MVRNRLNEAAISSEKAAQMKLALSIEKFRFINSYVLYDTVIANDLIETAADPLNVNFSEAIIGTIDTDAPEGKQYGAREVKLVAAKSGYGPLMYDIALSKERGLTPNRPDNGNVSSKARNIWKHYFSNRSDISHKELDDMNNPKTPPTEDDSTGLYGVEFLDQAYFGVPVNTSQLEANHEKFISSLLNKYDSKTVKFIDREIQWGRIEFFRGLYDEGVNINAFARLNETIDSSEGQSSLGLCIKDTGFIKNYILYNVDVAESIAKNVKFPGNFPGSIVKFAHEFLPCIVAMIGLNKPRAEQYGTLEVAGVAAEKGYGPLIYDIALSHEKGLTPDRPIGGSVSDAARNIWRFYFNNRPDVKHKKLDDKFNPKTPPKLDDTDGLYGERDHEFEDPNIEFLNYAYFKNGSINTKPFIANHKMLELHISNINDRIDKEMLTKMLDFAADEFFSKKY